MVLTQITEFVLVICSEMQLVAKPDAHSLSLSTQIPFLIFRYANDRSFLCFLQSSYPKMWTWDCHNDHYHFDRGDCPEIHHKGQDREQIVCAAFHERRWNGGRHVINAAANVMSLGRTVFTVRTD